jgi:molybdenum cofactor cytidylyltransferase
MTLAVLIPAAGSSSRLGQAKQLVNFHGQPMLQDRIRLCARTIPSSSKIFCVLGDKAHQIRHQVIDHRCRFLFYPLWQKGLSHTIGYGVSQLPEQMSAVMILLCDQWAVTEGDLNCLVKKWHEQPNHIIASKYTDIIGVPAIFPRRFFSKLIGINNDDGTGAKKLIEQHGNEVVAVNLERAQFDLDTPEQLQTLQQQQNAPYPK